MDSACLLTRPGASGPAGLPGRYDAVRAATTALAAPLSPEDCQAQSMPDCSPVKWHLAHTTWFFETFLLSRHAPGYRAFHPSYRMLFNSYYNAIGARHPRRSAPAHASGPGRGAALPRACGRGHACADRPPGRRRGIRRLLALGLNHEQQHQELILTDIKHLLYANPLRPAYAANDAPPCRRPRRLAGPSTRAA